MDLPGMIFGFLKARILLILLNQFNALERKFTSLHNRENMEAKAYSGLMNFNSQMRSILKKNISFFFVVVEERKARGK